MPLSTLDLILDPLGDAAVRAQWQALRGAGLPSLATHRGATHAPHLTLLAAPQIPGATLELAQRSVPALLPLDLAVDGLLILGGGPYVLAHHVLAPPQVLGARDDLAASLPADPERPDRPWSAHITLATRLTAPQVAAALEILAGTTAPARLRATTLRHWDPRQGTAEPLEETGR